MFKQELVIFVQNLIQISSFIVLLLTYIPNSTKNNIKLMATRTPDRTHDSLDFKLHVPLAVQQTRPLLFFIYNKSHDNVLITDNPTHILKRSC